MSNELLPCPSCKSAGFKPNSFQDEVSCSNEDCVLHNVTVWKPVWNSRPTNDLQERNRELEKENADLIAGHKKLGTAFDLAIGRLGLIAESKGEPQGQNCVHKHTLVLQKQWQNNGDNQEPY